MPTQKRYRSIIDTIRTDRQFGQMSYVERDCWHGLIATADDQGRHLGNPMYIKSIIWPYDDITVQDVITVLDSLEDKGMITQYQSNGDQLIQINKWWKHQRMRYAIPSDYPAPEGWTDRVNYTGPGREHIRANWGKDEGGYKKVKDRDMDKDTTHQRTPNPDLGSIYKAYERNIGLLVPAISEEINDYFEEIGGQGKEWITDAINIAAQNNKRNWAYIRAILKDWIAKGRQDIKGKEKQQSDGLNAVQRARLRRANG